MTPTLRRMPRRRPDMRKAVFLFPSGLTLLNLFFGIFAIIAASRLEFTTAGVYVVIGGICDALDGRVARATNAGSQFGEELDSLVDAITFGLAPGMIMYFAVLNRGGWDWVWVFAFAAAAVLRLARFNIEQAGTAKTYFQGLPSPAAGITLASYYWFSESWLYSYGRIANLNWHFTLRLLIAALAALMISNVPYPTFPRTGFRSIRALASSVVVFGAFALLLTGRLEYFFPIAILYVVFGLLRWMLGGLFERRQPTLPYDLSEGEEDEDEEEFDDDDELALAGRPLPAGRSAARDSGGSRVDRGRVRPARSGRDDAEAAPARAERGARRPDRPDRSERAPRAERGERPASERTSDADRAARREKKRDRPKRGDRPDRADRPARTESAAPGDAADSTPVTVAAPALSAPTAARPVPELVPTEDEELFTDDEGAEANVDETSSAGSDARASADGAPARKRKRRRRRGGERKERGPGDAAASEAPGSSPATPSSADHDPSPYAPAPTAYSPPTPATVPVHFPSTASTPSSPPASPAAPSPAAAPHESPAPSSPATPPTRSEPSE